MSVLKQFATGTDRRLSAQYNEKDVFVGVVHNNLLGSGTSYYCDPADLEEGKQELKRLQEERLKREEQVYEHRPYL